jgi:hypothetical protein
MVDGTEWANGGKIVRVTTQAVSGGAPMVQLWHVAIDTDDEAIARVRADTNSSDDNLIEIVGHLTAEVLKELRIPRGTSRTA